MPTSLIGKSALRNPIWVSTILLLGLLCALRPAWSQEVTAAIVGSVVDPSGAPIKGATVVARDTERGVVWNATSNDTGSFDILRLPIGTYTAEATAAGFEKTVYPPFTLVLNQTARLTFKMKVGKVSETVEVTGSAPILQTEDAQVGTVIDSSTLTSLALTTRNYIQLTLLTPGVVTTDPSTFNLGSQTAEGAVSGGGRPYINGNREEDNNFLLDGVDNNQASDNLTGYTPSPDAIGEFNLITQNASAEFGNYAGGIINATIKSGTNSFHGDVFEFIRNNVFNANQWENSPFITGTATGNPTAALRWNMFGATFGGPIIKNKLFFFVDYQGGRLDHPATSSNITVLTQAETTGDFSGLLGLTAPYTPIQLFNPCQTGTGGTSGTSCVIQAPASRAAFNNNMIPPQDLDPVFTNLVTSQYYPKSVGTLASGFGTAVNTTDQQYNSNQGDVKVDYNVSSKDHINARYSKADQNDPATNSQPLLGNTLNEAWLNNGSANWTHSFSPTLLNEVRFGKNAIKLLAPTYTFSIGDLANTLGIQDGNPAGISGFPLFGFAGGTGSSVGMGTLTNLGALVNPQKFSSTVTQFDEELIYTHGRHVIRTGFQLQRYNLNVFYPGNAGELGAEAFGLGAGGNYSGNGASTGADIGDPSADFALGLPESVGRGVSTGGWHARDWLIAGFVQDDWRVTDSLTVNLGLRYEARTPWTELNNHQVNVNIFTGALQFPGSYTVPTGIVGTNGFPAGLYPGTYGLPDFQPRLGFAWSPHSLGGSTVIRGGIAISSFQEGTGTNLRPTQNPPFTPPQSAATNVGGTGTMYPLAAAFSTATAFSTAAPPAGDEFINSTLQTWTNVQPAVADQWNLTIQRELLRNTTFQIGYVGQRTTHLMVPIDLDQGELGPNNTVTYPFIGGQNQPGTVINGIVTNATTYGPNGVYLVKQSAGVGNMNYNAMQVVLQKKYSNGLEGQVSYTWQKCMANSAGYYGSWGGQSQNADSYWQNIFDPNADYAQCYWDAKHVVSMYAVYDLPFGRGKQFAGNAPTALNEVIGNWSINPIISWHSGFPLNLRGPDNSGTNDIYSPRPDCNGPVSYPKTPIVGGMQWFDPSPFSAPAPFTFGNCPAQGPVIGPGYFDADLSLQKNFLFTESKRLQFRADFLNATNHPSFNAPSTSLGSGMGVLNTTQSARQMQFALKFYF
jgi:hypothetical protein